MGMKLLILLAIAGEALAWTAPPSSRQYHIQTDEGPERYFRYQTDSGQYRKERRLADGTVVGSEGWVDANGYLRFKDYIADDGGYRILKSKTVFVGKGRPIDEAIKSAKSAPAQSGILTGARGSSYIPPSSTPRPPVNIYIPSSPAPPTHSYIPASPSPKPVYITPRPNALHPGHRTPSPDFLPPLSDPQRVAPLAYAPPEVVPLGRTGSTPRPSTYFVSSTVRPITGYVASSGNPVRVLTPSTAHPIPSYDTSTPGPSSVAPLSNSYASSTVSPLSSTALSLSSYGSSTPRPHVSSYGTPVSSYSSTVSSYEPSSPIYVSSTPNPVSDYTTSSTIRPAYERPYKYVSAEPQPFSLGNALGDGYRKQYTDSTDGVYTSRSGFRYFLPKLYHEEANSGDERIGSFGYVDPFGIRRVIYYNAGPGTGFRHRHNNRYVGLNGTPYDPRPS